MTIDNAVGIDVSMHESTFVGLRRPEEVVLCSRLVPHTTEALKSIAAEILALPGATVAFCECTGVYHEPVVKALREAGVAIVPLNPLLVHKFGGDTLRKVETDKADARKIALYGLTWGWKFTPSVADEPTREMLKLVSRQYAFFTKQKTAQRNHLHALSERVFPGVQGLFTSQDRDDGLVKWVDFLDEFPHAECVSKLSLAKFTEHYKKWCKKHRYYAVNGDGIYAHAKSCVPSLSWNSDTKLLVQTAIAQVNQVAGTAAVYQKRMVELAKSLPEYEIVDSLYGCGDSTGPQLMAEIGDVRRFSANKGYKSLVAFAGLAPGDSQSGTFDAASVPIEKRGSTYLRRALFCAVQTYLLQSPEDEPVYKMLDRKRSEGKVYLVFMTAAMNKFLRIYYARVMEYFAKLAETTSFEPADCSTPEQSLPNAAEKARERSDRGFLAALGKFTTTPLRCAVSILPNRNSKKVHLGA
jgi:transposase